VEAAMTGDGAGALGKVRKGLDYVDRATQVTLISDEAPVGDVEMTRPGGESSPELQALADRYGLKNPVDRLLSALRAGSKKAASG